LLSWAARRALAAIAIAGRPRVPCSALSAATAADTDTDNNDDDTDEDDDAAVGPGGRGGAWITGGRAQRGLTARAAR
jgi:hypothetical protein